MTLVWAQRGPTVHGWYWYAPNGDMGNPVMVLVEQNRYAGDGFTLNVFLPDDEMGFVASCNPDTGEVRDKYDQPLKESRFAGPIPHPDSLATVS